MSRVSQSTFNAAVVENMQEFDMAFEEAIHDAKEQFAAEGVDVSDLITDGLTELVSPEAAAAGAEAVEAALADAKHPTEAIRDSLKAVAESGAASGPLGSASTVTSSLEGFNALVELLTGTSTAAVQQRCASVGVVQPVCVVIERLVETLEAEDMDQTAVEGALLRGLEALRRLTYRCDECRAIVSEGAINALASCIVSYSMSRPAVATSAARCAGTVATRSEGFKRRLYERETIPAAMALFEGGTDDASRISAVSSLLRAVTSRDDLKAPISKATEYAKAISTDGKTVPLLVRGLAVASATADWGRVADLFLALRAVHIHNEACNALLDSSALSKVVVASLDKAVNACADAAKASSDAAASPASSEDAGTESSPSSSEDAGTGASLPRAVRAGFSLLKAVCNSDAVKRAMVDPVVAAGGAGRSAAADWTGGGSAKVLGLAPSEEVVSGVTKEVSELADHAPALGINVMLKALRAFALVPDVADQALGALANTVLRIPENATAFVEAGGAHEVVTLMRRHPSHAMIQKHSALVLRNAASWNKALIPTIVGTNPEALLRAAQVAHPEVAGEAVHAALRDLLLD
jgi:hypothetical protein